MKRILEQNDPNKIEFVVIPWRYDASVFAKMKCSDFGERFWQDAALDSEKDSETEYDNRVAEFSPVAARVSIFCAHFCRDRHSGNIEIVSELQVVTYDSGASLTACRTLTILFCQVCTAVVSRILSNYLPQFRDLILFISTTQ